MENHRQDNKKWDSNCDPITGQVGAHPVGAGVGAVVGGGAAGAALGSGAAALVGTGATLGAAAGPIGVVAGAVAGGIVGGLVGKRVAESIHPTVEVAYDEGYDPDFSDPEEDTEYRRAYRDAAGPPEDEGWDVGRGGSELSEHWPSGRASANLDWEKQKLASYEAWNELLEPLEKESDGTVDQLDRLLRAELKAVETYRQVVDRFGHEPEVDQIAEEHRHAVETLEKHITQLGDQPPTSSGPWGAWLRATEDTGNAFDKDAALAALREGEEYEVENYAEALQYRRLNPECHTLIHDQLLPQTQAHIDVLERLMDL
jgi:hypothetical protein